MRTSPAPENLGRPLVEGLKLFARLEANGPAWGDVHLLAGTRISSDACFAGLHGEDAEAAKLDPVARRKRAFHSAQDRVNGGLSLVPRKSGTFHDALDEILLDQAGTPFIERTRPKGERLPTPRW